MPLRRSESSVTGKRKLLSVSDEQSTSSNWKQPFSIKKTLSTTYSRATALLQMNVSCYATRTRYLNGYYSRKVGSSTIARGPITESRPGIDVQAELRHKASPNLRPVRHGASMTGQPSPMHKAIMNRQQQARQRPTLASPIQTVNTSQSNLLGEFAGSPVLQQTPTSQQSSPSTLRSPGFPMNASMASPTGELPGPQPQRSMSQIQHNSYATQARSHARNPSSNFASQQFNHGSRHQQTGSMQSSFYQSSFQKHYDQLGKLTPDFPLSCWLVELCSS